MKNSSFGLREEPFGTDLPVRAPFASTAHREAFNGFFLALLARRRLMALFGETGIGKSTLLRALISHIDSDGAVVLAVTARPGMSVEDIILGAAPTLEDAPPSPMHHRPTADLEAVVTELENRVENAGTGILIVDEAQRLDLGVVQDLVELASSDTETGRFLQVLLSGDHMLERMLADPSIEGVLRSMGIAHHLPPLDEEDTDAFIRERLRLSGAEEDDIFDPAAVAAAASLSGGLPGILNALCRRAFRSTVEAGEERVTAQRMFRAAEDLGIEPLADIDLDIPDMPLGEVPEPVRRAPPAGRGAHAGTAQGGPRPAAKSEAPPPARPAPQQLKPAAPRPVVAGSPGWQAAQDWQSWQQEEDAGPATETRRHDLPAAPPIQPVHAESHRERPARSLRADRYRDRPTEERAGGRRSGRAGRAVVGIAAIAGLAGLGFYLLGEEDMQGAFREPRDIAALPAPDLPADSPPAPEARLDRPDAGYESLIPRTDPAVPEPAARPEASPEASYEAPEPPASPPAESVAAPPIPAAPEMREPAPPALPPAPVETARDDPPPQAEEPPPEPPQPAPVQSAALPPPPAPAERPQEPDPAQEAARQLAALTDRAERQIAEKLLTTPAGDNAYETYRQMAALAPGHPAAADILAQIKDTYLGWAVAAEGRGAFEDARRFYERGLSVDPQDGDFRRRLAALDARQRQETAAAEAPPEPPPPAPAADPNPEQVLRLPPGYVQPDEPSPGTGTPPSLAAASPPPAPPLPAPNAFATRDDMIAAINRPDMLRAVIEAGRNLDRELPDGKTALMLAAERGRGDAIRMLLEAGAAPNARSRNGGTALMYAASIGDENAIRALIRHGGAVNAMNVDGKTALMAAAQAGHAGTVRLLLENGAEVNARSVQGRTALDYAGEAGQQQVVMLLRLYGAEPSDRGPRPTAGEPLAPRPGGPIDLRAFRG